MIKSNPVRNSPWSPSHPPPPSLTPPPPPPPRDRYIFFLIILWKCILCVLIWSASMRCFKWVSKTCIFAEKYQYSTVDKVSHLKLCQVLVGCTCHKVHFLTFTVLSTLLGKMLFAWRFILDDNILFWLTISYQKHLLFLFLCFVLKYLP